MLARSIRGSDDAVPYSPEAEAVVGCDLALVETWTMLFSYTQHSVVHVVRQPGPGALGFDVNRIATPRNERIGGCPGGIP
jgi:hypothetical protein